MMKPIRLKAVLLAMTLSAGSSWVGNAEPPVRNCAWCHGTSGQGLTPAPRLAGQRRPYIERQLKELGVHARDNPHSKQYMWSVAENMPPQTIRDLATYFSTLPARAANDGMWEHATLGRQIYQEGMPEANIAACVVCHGPSGEGVGEIPRLSGLGYDYLKTRLETWGEGYDAAALHPMPSVAHKLSPHQIEALASYLSFLE